LTRAHTELDALGSLRRTHSAREILTDLIGSEVVLGGWVHRRRDHGGVIFVDLRDRGELVQVVFKPEVSTESHDRAGELRSEYVIVVRGTVRRRSDETINPKMRTGEVEVDVCELRILNRATPPPFPIEDEVEADEATRLCHRIHDLRRGPLQRALALRHTLYQSVRRTLVENGFLEIETPYLAKSTPEGARDFLVPSRQQHGSFYALPQSPQIMKQLLMIAGFDRYFQIVRCFRDEDQRADRQLEFTQVDLEMSFVGVEEVLSILEEVTVRGSADAAGVQLPRPFCLPIHDASELGRGAVDRLERFVKKELGAKGLAWIRVTDDGSWQSPIVKFFSEAERAAVAEATGARPGSLVFFQADEPTRANAILARLREDLGRQLGRVDDRPWDVLFIVDFPLFEPGEGGRLTYIHQPFVAPVEADIPLLDSVPEKARGTHYDVVLNGVELGSGSLRNHRSDVQRKVFDVMGYSKEEAEARFGFLLNALDSGAPPHGGFAFGYDRWAMLLAGVDNLRDVIAFPKTQRGQDLLMDAPTRVEQRQLDELGIHVPLRSETDE
jgi:aspartyl-tRNA synthetase